MAMDCALTKDRVTEASLLNQSSCLAAAYGVTKFIMVRTMILLTLKSDLDV